MVRKLSLLPFALPDRYEFLGKVLSGGQGDVFICRDKSLEREVAVKSLHTKSAPAALVKEIAARAKIKSKHVAEVYECLTDDKGVPVAIVMEYVPGESLQEDSERPTTLAARLLLLYQMACGVAEIHEADVIHRDIKPLNMKVDVSGVLKIFDLGIANIDAVNASTVGGAGTYVFSAPELYLPPPMPVTKAVDVYALGVCAWFLFSDHIPAPLLESPPQESGRPVPSIISEIPHLQELATCIDRTLLKNPANRPTSDQLRRCVAAAITYSNRRGVFSLSDEIHELTDIGAITRLEVARHGSLEVAYTNDGRFVVRECVGEIFINNLPATTGAELPDSCVITFGSPAAGSRTFVPFDVSQPEIVL